MDGSIYSESFVLPCEVEDNSEERDAEARANAVKGRVSMCENNRGDVGSWVGEAAIDGLERCTYLLCKGELKGFFSKSEQMELVSVSQLNETNQMKFVFDESVATCLKKQWRRWIN
ncbi:hypothetical protein HAX54_031663 [Datura stramonium]|uniref:Uncharacterized protein n=1 Tax=Datura stramonium TaxID=4076 RepID=A0ABS8VBT1_DATST|nr:hypothetical protein [Datura stramonium]